MDYEDKSFMVKSLLNELPGGVAIFKISDKFDCLYYSDGFAALSHRSREEIDVLIQNGIIAQSVVAPSDYEEFLEEVLYDAQNGLPINLSFRYKIKDEGIGWLHLAGAKMREEDGYPVYYCIFTNPSDETALFQNIVEDSAIGVFVASRANRQILYLNDSVCGLFGFKNKNSMISKNMTDLVPEDKLLLTHEQVLSLTDTDYSEFHIGTASEIYLGIKAKALKWNGIDAYILYITNETKEHNHQIYLQNLIDNIPSGIGIFDIIGGNAYQVYFNESFYKLLSDTRSNRDVLRPDNFYEGIHSDDVNAIREVISSVSYGADFESCNYRSKTGLGDYIWLRLDVKVVSRTSQKTTAYCCFTDISEAMKIRKNLEKSNAMVIQQYNREVARRDVIEKGSAVIETFDLKKQRLIKTKVLDQRFAFFLTNSIAIPTEKQVLSIIPNEKDQMKMKKFFDFSSVKERIQKGILEESIEVHMKLPSGQNCWVKVVYNIVDNPLVDEQIGYVYFYDIDDQKKARLAEESVVDEEIEYVLLLNRITMKTKLIKAKQAIEPLFNETLDLASIDNRVNISSIFESVLPQDFHSVEKFIDMNRLVDILNKKEVATITFRQKVNGNIRRKKARAFYLDQSKEDIVIARRDITDLYREEQHQKEVLQEAVNRANEANRAKSDFLSRMSHDMRTPLNAILGFTSHEMLHDATEKQKDEYLHDIHTSGTYLLGIINDVLDMSKIENSKIVLQPEAYSTFDFIANIDTIIGEQCRQKNLTFVVSQECHVERFMMVDQTHFNQVFINLLSNSAKYTPNNGKVFFRIKEIRKLGDNEYLERFEVEDNGIGMSKDFLPHAFDSFSQENRLDNLTPSQGTGLGLSIVKQLVELMKGTISVTSEVGKGTKFVIEMPLLFVDEKDTDSVMADPESVLQNKRILLCEDHPINAKIAIKLLEKVGCIIDHVENGKLGLEKFQNAKPHEYDCILMDIRMPVMDGIEATKQIRALEREDAQRIPIIAMTANAFSDDVEQTRQAGMSEHLSKPIEPEKLYQTLVHLFIN